MPLKHLKPGMVLAKNVENGTSLIPLVVAGQKLTTPHIKRLERHGVRGAYIQSKALGDADVEDYIDPAFKRATMLEVKKIFIGLDKRTGISRAMYHSISDTVESLVKYVISKEECMFNMVDIKEYDTYTYTHSMDVGIISALVGVKMGMSKSDLGDLTMCGLLHDTGKLDIPLAIVNKPAKLTAEEFTVMQTHPDNAVEHLRPCCQIPSRVLDGIQSHHEHFDGGGYPRHLAREGIPLFGRILALADVFDALTSERSYRAAWSADEALKYISERSGTQFDPELLKVFISVVAAFPIGSIIKLSNNYVAAVLRNSFNSSTRPRVRVLLPEECSGMEIDLATDKMFQDVEVVGLISDDQELPAGLFSI